MRRLFFTLFLLAAGRQDAPTPTEEIDRLIASSGLREPRIGIVVASAREDRVLYSRAAGDLLPLASNTKLFTAAAALDHLGPDHVFGTELLAEEIVGGAAQGLVVTGDGDPHLSGRDFDGNPCALFERWAGALKEKGVARVEGPIRLVADKFEHPPLPFGWKGQPQDQWYAAPVDQFSLNDNCVDVEYAPGAQEGDPVRITLRPDTRFVEIRNESRTVKGKVKVPFQFVRNPGSNRILFRGEVPLRAGSRKTWVAIEDPRRYFGTVLKETLERSGIPVSGGIESLPLPPPNLQKIARHESRLDRILQVCLTHSQNFYAEMILLHLAWNRCGKGTFENGLRVLEEFVRKHKLGNARLRDGSGLTRENLASPDSVLSLLKLMRGHRHAKTFYEALAVNGGEQGTLRKRMKDARCSGRIHAKTGHLDGVATLSGFIEAEDGDTLLFSILIELRGPASTGPADRLQDRICERLARLGTD